MFISPIMNTCMEQTNDLLFNFYALYKIVFRHYQVRDIPMIKKFFGPPAGEVQ